MGRTDVRALFVPELPAAFDSAAGAAALTSMLTPTAAAPVAAAPEARKPEHCPHCSARLSGVDLKFDRCMGCGSSLSGASVARVSIGL